MTNKTVKVLRVSSRSGNFRRAGYAFGTEPQDLSLAALPEATRTAIVNEPMLVAVEVEEPAEVGAGSKPALVDDAPDKKAPSKAKG